MALLDELFPASYKGAEFLIEKAKTDGGRKDALHEFPNSDKQNVEDLGLKPRTYRITGIISGNNYIQKRDRLLRKLEEGGKGALIHPFYGNLSDMVCRTFSLNEDLTRLGDASITMVFTISDDIGIPVASESTVSVLNAANEKVQSGVGSDIENGFSVSRKFRESFTDASDTLNRVFDAFDENTKIVSQLTSGTNEFSSLINEFSTNINNLVRQPQALADSINNLFMNVNGLYATAENTLDVFKQFFDFDDDENRLPLGTVSRTERQRNNDVIKQSIQLSALNYAYLNSAQTDFLTVDEIDELADTLEAQFEKVVSINDTLNKDLEGQQTDLGTQTINDLKDMRTQTQNFFENAKLTTNQVIDIYTQEIPVRVLAYQYYGETDSAEDLISLNNDPNVSFYKGDVEILTQ